jgi:hypothetical protein
MSKVSISRLIETYHLVVIFLFMTLFYTGVQFYFGTGNNVEELPLIYKMAGIADYPNDQFVNGTAGKFNYIYPYTFLLASATKLLGLSSLPYLFFLLHFVLFLALLLALQRIVSLVRKTSDQGFLFILLMLLFFWKGLQLVPNHRALFWRTLDPEFACFPFLFWAVALFLQGRYTRSALLLFLGNLIHPLYALPIAGAILTVFFIQFLTHKKVTLLGDIAKYLLAVLPYAILLWYATEQGPVSSYNASLMHEHVAHPQHLVIPSARTHNRLSYLRFLEEVVLLLGVSIIILFLRRARNSTLKVTDVFLSVKQYFSKEKWSARFLLYILAISLISYLVLASIIASFTRVAILVQLTPYRMGVFLFVFTLILFLTSLYDTFSVPYSKVWKRVRYPFLAIVFILCFYKNWSAPLPFSSSTITTINWINNNTEPNSLFLNYSDIDIRTTCFRSEYFRNKTIPLSNSEQVLWYERLLNYFNIPEQINGTSYKKVGKYIRREGGLPIDLQTVVNNIKDVKPSYLLIGEVNKYHFSNLGNWPVLYQQDGYKLYELNNADSNE